MICRICGEDINEKGQNNVSPISGYPVCEDCKGDIECEECSASNFCHTLYYVEKIDKVLCRDCLVNLAEERNCIYSTKKYFTEEWQELGDCSDLEPIIDYIIENHNLGIQEVK